MARTAAINMLVLSQLQPAHVCVLALHALVHQAHLYSYGHAHVQLLCQRFYERANACLTCSWNMHVKHNLICVLAATHACMYAYM